MSLTPVPKPPKPIRLSNAEYDLMKRMVLRRDGYKCRNPECKVRQNLHVHHITFRSQGGGDTSYNLIVVCKDCHDNIHIRHLTLLPLKEGEEINANKGVRWRYER